MPIWIRSLRGRVALRDGLGHGAPVRSVGDAPVLFVAIDRARVEADPHLEIVEAPTRAVGGPPPATPPTAAPSEPSPLPSTESEPAGLFGPRRSRRRGRR